MTSDSPEELLKEFRDTAIDILGVSVTKNEESQQLVVDAAAVMKASAEKNGEIPQQVAQQLNQFLKDREAVHQKQIAGEVKQLNDYRLKLDARKQSLDQRAVAVDDAEAKKYLVGLKVFGCVALVSAAAWFFFLRPALDELKHYEATHEQLEASSVFGAEVRTDDAGVTYVLFDEGVITSTCNIPNCVVIKK